jgi:dimethylhistidine N-methyltransferase
MTTTGNVQGSISVLSTDADAFRGDVIAGLLKERKELPCKHLYDDRGSILFERICNLDEYYIPRIEKEIMDANLEEIAEHLGEGVVLVEYGCGDCAKTRFLLDGLRDVAAFVPIDISREQLARVSGELRSEYPGLSLMPVCADFTSDFELPCPKQPSERVVVYFPGSTIGNFHPVESGSFLRRIARACGPGGGLLIGVDLDKDPLVLYDAYNDPEGVTAAFNLNLLERINRELGADFDTDSFEHQAVYNAGAGRVEMHLVSLADQAVHVDGATIDFSEGESIWTESSYKYTLEGFRELAGDSGFEVERVWTDEFEWFSVQYLAARSVD